MAGKIAPEVWDRAAKALATAREESTVDITNMEVDCSGRPCVKVWAKCESADDVDDIIAWLHLAKSMMIKWEAIRAKRNAKPPQTTEAPAGKDEAPQRRKVQGQPQVAVGTDGKQSSEVT